MRYIFGHGPSMYRHEFTTPAAAMSYLHQELPDQRAFRYRTTYTQRDVDSIIFAFRGLLLAELVVGDVQRPAPDDLAAYAKTKTVYLIDEIRHFADQTLRASAFGLIHYQSGKVVLDAVYADMLARTGGFSETRKR